MTASEGDRPVLETSVSLVKGTADWLPSDHARLSGLEALVLERFARAGYERLNTPVLEPMDLHERKSGAGIVSKLFELSGSSSGRVCLRPELTAGIVRAYTEAEPCPDLPWRVSHAGTAFRRESSGRADRLREFHQVGVERLGDSGAAADAEVIWLADWTLAQTGVRDARIRLGHVGLTLEILGRSGLPPTAQTALVEMLSEAAAEGGGRRLARSRTRPLHRMAPPGFGRRRNRAPDRSRRRRWDRPTVPDPWCRSSTAGDPVMRLSIGSGASGISATAGSNCSTGSATRFTPSPTFEGLRSRSWQGSVATSNPWLPTPWPRSGRLSDPWKITG